MLAYPRLEVASNKAVAFSRVLSNAALKLTAWPAAPTTYGETVTLTARVPRADGSATPTGRSLTYTLNQADTATAIQPFLPAGGL